MPVNTESVTLMKPIWIVDDDQSIRFVLEKALLREGLPTRSFTNPREVMKALEAESEGPQVLVSDIRMPGGSGLDLLAAIKQRMPGLPVIIMTAFSDLDSAVSAFSSGAFEYLPKPFDLPKAVELIRRAVGESQREDVTEEKMTDAPEMLGQAPAMQDVFRGIGRLAQSHVTVLITGESGSGKELVAHALHKHSPRANQPFVAINTAAIPKDLLESELFGHERGAFTGAQASRRGRFEQADGGTLFLDEIGDMPFDLQTRLLRVLSDGNFYRVGGHSAVKANVRVIAAQRSAQQLGVEPKRMDDAALERLSHFQFPGNVRQLENICHWLTVMAPSQLIEVKDLPPEVLEAGPVPGSPARLSVAGPGEVEGMAPSDALAHPGAIDFGGASRGGAFWDAGLEQEALALLNAGRTDVWDVLTRRFETSLIQAALATTRGRRIEAAQKLGIGRNTITRKIQELGIDEA